MERAPERQWRCEMVIRFPADDEQAANRIATEIAARLTNCPPAMLVPWLSAEADMVDED